MLQVRLDQLNPRWTSSLVIGVIGFPPDNYKMPANAIGIKKSSWMVHGDAVFQSGIKVRVLYNM